MSFLRNASKGTNLVSTYFLTLAIVVLAYILIGQIPMIIDLVVQSRLYKLSDGSVSELVDIFGKNKFLVYLILPFVFSLIMLLVSVRFFHRRPILSVVTSREKFDWKRFFLSFVLFGSVLTLSLISIVITSDKVDWNFNGSTFFPLLLISLFLIPLQTTCEEVLFRGYLFQGFGHFYKRGWISVLVTGVLFGLMHSANPEVDKLGMIVMVFYIGTGLFLGIVTLMDDGLELSMGYHAINNIFAALIITNDWQAFQTDALFIDRNPPSFGLDSLATIFIVQPILLLIFSKVYKWKGWKEKFLGQEFEQGTKTKEQGSDQ
jgi:membrane protease YdiL (CAAX protease family)